jgi:hypothetical protein
LPRRQGPDDRNHTIVKQWAENIQPHASILHHIYLTIRLLDGPDTATLAKRRTFFYVNTWALAAFGTVAYDGRLAIHNVHFYLMGGLSDGCDNALERALKYFAEAFRLLERAADGQAWFDGLEVEEWRACLGCLGRKLRV